MKFPVRIKCATLAWNTLQQGLDDADQEAGGARLSPWLGCGLLRNGPGVPK